MRLFVIRNIKSPKQTSEDLLNELKDSKNFVDKSKIDKLLISFKNFSKGLNLSERNSTRILESKNFIESLSNWASALPLLNAAQTGSLTSVLGFLQVNEEEIWSKLEKHIQRKVLKDLDQDLIAEITRASLWCGRKSDALWNSLESHILKNIYPAKSFNATQLVQIYHDFRVSNKGSAALNQKFSQNILEVVASATGKELNKLIFVLAKDSYVDEEMIERISKRGAEICSELDPKSIMHLVGFFIKNHASHKYLSEVELEVIKKLNLFALNQLSYVVYHYAKFPTQEVMKSKNKMALMKAIEERLYTARKVLVEGYRNDDLDNQMVKLMWGLSKHDCIYHKKLWKDYGKEISANQNYLKVENAVFVREVKNFLMSHGLY